MYCMHMCAFVSNNILLLFLVLSFTEMAPLLLKLNGAQFLYSERFCQDDLEEFFGKQRARGRRSDNPTVQQFMYNTQAIVTGKSLAQGRCSNLRKRKVTHSMEELSAPLKKRSIKRPIKCRVLQYNSN